MIKKYFYLAALLLCSYVQAQTSTDPGNDPGDLGTITFIYKGTPTTYTTVRAKDGNVWLQQNLGSANIATSATDEPSYGDLFQWGRWDDTHQERTSAVSASPFSPNNPSGLSGGAPDFSSDWWSTGAITDTWEAATPAGATAENGCDPCKALGTNWTMPTEANWAKIITDEAITNVASAYNSTLKLAVGGTRNSSGTFSFVGQRGYYWSKTPSTTNVNFVKYFYYSNAVVNQSAGTYRKQTASVRCLKIIPPVSYCNVSVDNDVEPLTLVNFANINNVTSEVVNATPAYEDFTQTTGNVKRGNTYTLTVKGNTVGQFDHDIRAFFDWNNDGVFDMTTEYYHTSLSPSTGIDGVQATVDIEIPANATLGNIRMRIIKDQWNIYEEGEFDACLNAYYGQVEDYTLNIEEHLSNEDFNQSNFRMYPNPTEGIVTIQTDKAIKNITLYNAIGQPVITQKEALVNLTALPSGIYIIRVALENGQTISQKVVKK